MKVFVNNRDLLWWTKAMVERLQREPGAEVIVIDNASTYGPLLDWYATKPCEVVRQRNIGHHSLWMGDAAGETNLLKTYVGTSGYYAFTNNDLDINDVPLGLLDRLTLGLQRYSFAVKCGMWIRMDDLPDTELGRLAREWSAPAINRGKKLDEEFYGPNQTDTDMAVYEVGRGITHGHSGFIFTSVRSAPPYQLRHLPWYLDVDHPETVPEDYMYYLKHMETGWVTTSPYLRKKLLGLDWDH